VRAGTRGSSVVLIVCTMRSISRAFAFGARVSAAKSIAPSGDVCWWQYSQRTFSANENSRMRCTRCGLGISRGST
jgi:hypothetical protein